MKEFFRRWRYPLLASLLINFGTLVVMGGYFRGETIATPVMLSVKRIRLVSIPQTVTRQQRVPVVMERPKSPDKRPREPLVTHHNMASASRAGAKRVPHIVHMAKVTPTTPHPRPQQQVANRDPFMPDVAPATVIHQTRARKTTQIVSPPATTVSPKPVQIASSSGVGQATSPTAHPNPYGASQQGVSQPGSGGNGTGERGSGSGGGGVLPFGLGGRGGSGKYRIVYVLDVSGSMTSRINRAVQELDTSLASLSRDDLFDIFTFSTNVNQMEPYLEPATSDDLAEARWFLSHLNVIGGTNLEEALSEALALPHVNEVMLITDGVPTVGETDFRALAQEIRYRNISHARIDVVGLVGINPDGTDQSFEATTLLRNIAHDSNGSFKLVPLGEATQE